MNNFSTPGQTLLLSYLQETTWQNTNALFTRITGVQQGAGVANITLATLYRQNATSSNYSQVSLI